MLRDYINATIGFEVLAAETGTPVKSLMRMFGPSGNPNAGNPNAGNLFSVIEHLQSAAGIRLEVHAARKPKRVREPA